MRIPEILSSMSRTLRLYGRDSEKTAAISTRLRNLPKRARCPHCDRLFNRDELDRHIMRCRSRTRAQPQMETRKTRKTVIVDGNNVAFHLSANGKPQVNNLLLYGLMYV